MAGHAYLVRTSNESAQVVELARAATVRAAELGIPLSVIRARSYRMWEEAPERRAEFLDPLDARNLYRALHREDVVVLTLGAVHVRRDPARDPPARRTSLTLESFVAHKAVYGLVRSSAHIAAHFARLAVNQAEPAGCNGMDDPRALPLHTFETAADWARLGEPDEIAAFNDRYGRPGNRRDEGRKIWERARHFHGGAPLVVSRCTFPAGAHWDVSVDRGTATLRTTDQVWHVPSGRHDYLNVFPNAHVLKPGRSRCRLVWRAS